MRPEEYDSNPWHYRGRPVTEEDLKGSAAFVYLMVDTVTGEKYLGRKYLTSIRRMKKTDKRRKTTESDWRRYFSSSDRIKALVKEHGHIRIRREIIALCRTRGEANYLEVVAQFLHQVLESDNWINDTIGKYRRSSVRGYGKSLAEMREHHALSQQQAALVLDAATAEKE